MNSTAFSAERDSLRGRFLEHHGLGAVAVDALAQDASNRRYFRLAKGTQRYLLMDAPPPGEDVRPFLSVAEHLESLGARPPRIYQRDTANGFLLLEDLGDDTFTRLLDAGEAAAPLYQAAIDVLSALHSNPDAPRIDLPRYSQARLIDEALLLTDWFYPARYGQRIDADCRQGYITAWREVFHQLPPVSFTLVLRDFHVDNLMKTRATNSATSRADCALLDFQDAVLGPPAYDVVSLLEDARRDVQPELRAAMRTRYFDTLRTNGRPVDENAFMRWYRCLGAQRHAKVLGIFVRLFVRDDKDVYLTHLPRVAALFESHLDSPDLAPVRRWMRTNMPDPLTPLARPDRAKTLTKSDF